MEHTLWVTTSFFHLMMSIQTGNHELHATTKPLQGKNNLKTENSVSASRTIIHFHRQHAERGQKRSQSSFVKGIIIHY